MSGRLSRDRWRQLSPLLDELLELEGRERDRRLEQVADGDADLLGDLAALLAAHDEPPAILADPLDLADGGAREAPGPEVKDHRIGTSVAGYRLVRRLGQGGMATVYLGEREDGDFEHRVAVKLVRSDAAGGAVLRRFQDEQRILAGLSHPNVARLYGGGATDDRQPYILMELVDGEPITDYCDRRRLGVEDRLELFAAACTAVEYAHSNLVVHRDLKPSNVMVAAGGRVKLLDFGIAKLVEEDSGGPLAMGTLTSAYGHPMTPDFAAPEQFAGGPITTATDVYSLGVILYELLTGRRPLRTGSRLPHELAAAVLGSDAERPSSVVRRAQREVAGDPSEGVPLPQAAAARATTPQRLAHRLRGDLDTVLLTALRREPERRYPSAAALREDLERHRRHLPIRARRDSWTYRTGRFARRHAVAMGIATIVIASLVGGLALSLSGQRAARREAATSERVSRFLVELFKTTDPAYAPSASGTLTAADLLDEATERLASALDEDPVIRARLLQTIGESYQGIGMYDRAEELMRASDALFSRVRGEDDPDTLSARIARAGLYRVTGRLDEAEAMYRGLTAAADRARLPPEVELTLANDYGILLREQGRPEEAESLYRRALAIHRRLGTERSQEAARTLNNLAMAVRQQKRLDEAEALLERALEIQRETVGEPHVDVATTLNNLAAVVRRRGDLERAEALYREALTQRIAVLGDSHPAVAQSLNNVGFVLYQRGQVDAALERFREAYEIWRRAYEGDHPQLATALSNLGSICRRQERWDEAVAYLRRAEEMFERIHGPDHVAVASALLRWGGTLVEADRPVEAEPVLERALAIRRARFGDGHEDTVEAALTAAGAYRAAGRPRRAVAILTPVAAATADDEVLHAEVESALAELGNL